MVTRSVRTNGQTEDKRGGRTAEIYNAFAYTVGCRRQLTVQCGGLKQTVGYTFGFAPLFRQVLTFKVRTTATPGYLSCRLLLTRKFASWRKRRMDPGRFKP